MLCVWEGRKSPRFHLGGDEGKEMLELGLLPHGNIQGPRGTGSHTRAEPICCWKGGTLNLK